MSDQKRHVANLQLMLDVTRYLAATTDLDILLRTIIEAACNVLNCERATVFLYDSATNELYSRAATGVESIRFPADRGIAGTAARERILINVPDAYADTRFNPEIDRRTQYRTRSLLTFPLEDLGGDLVGVLQAVNKRSGAFTAADQELARILSAQTGVALHRWFLLEQYAEKKRMARDLEIAREIQRALFPRRNPEVSGYEIAGWNQSADETGGDCYDFVALADGRLAILLADATGHGIGAALVIAQCRSLARAMLSVTQELPRVADKVNRLLAQDLSDNRFVTAFLGILDPEKNRLDYISGGQGPLLMVTSSKIESRSATCIPFAVIDEMDCATSSFDFEPGSTLALLTDGFYETADPQGNLFGEDRVAEIIRDSADQPLETLIARLKLATRDFRTSDAPADDLTAVLIRRK